MNEFKSNSQRSKDLKNLPETKEKRERRTIGGDVKLKPKNAFVRFSDLFFAEDLASAKQHIIEQVVMPKLHDVIIGAVNILFYGSSATRSSSQSSPKPHYTSYYNPGDMQSAKAAPRKRDTEEFDIYHLTLDTRDDAVLVKEEMMQNISDYGLGTIADLKGILRVKPISTDYDYGWKTFSNAKIVPLTNGKYLLEIPRAIPLED